MSGSRELSAPGGTQLETIRELMLRLAERNAWLTLAEIAEQTQFGEASISAQLRHLRKACHGGYCVEKRRRRCESPFVSGDLDASNSSGLWEYQVLPRVANAAMRSVVAPAASEPAHGGIEHASDRARAEGGENA